MRKLDLKDYGVEVSTPEGPKTLPYSVHASIIEALYHPDLKLSARDLLENHRIAQKIRDAAEAVLLEESEYQRLRAAFETIRGFAKNDVELVRRVLDASTVAVKEA